jgi:hypothetical protein
VEEGDYDAGILTLDNAARRLAGDPARTRELSQAYLYLGIAYLGKGHEAAARAKFRDALGQLRDLVLSPEKFPPKVIDLFEAAREETRRAAPAAAPGTPAAAPAATPAPRKGGSKKGLILIGVGGAAAAGAALALGGGGGSSAPRDARQTKTFTGTLPTNDYRGYEIVASANGTLEATVTWTGAGAVLTMLVQQHNPPYTTIGGSNRINDTTAQLTVPVTGPTEYDLIVSNFSNGNATSFTVTVKHP